MRSIRSTSPRTGRSLLGAIVLVGALTSATLGSLPAEAVDDVGFRDFSYWGTSSSQQASAPTGQKPQSKLWFNNAKWWGVFFDRVSGDFHIFGYDWATHTWTDTGTLVDERKNAYIDSLWDGSHLYFASAGMKSNDQATDMARSPKLYRFSYNPSTDTYTLDSGFPATIGNGGMESIVFDKDSNGVLWATWVRGVNVFITHSTPGNDAQWVTPYHLPVTGAGNVLPDDDISAVVAYDGNRIGVMWSNQSDSANLTMYWAWHDDANPDDRAWSSTVAYDVNEGADDHINLKSLQADPAGRVFAATKTSRNGATDTLIQLLVLQPASTAWSSHPFGAVADQQTRPIVLIDTDNREVYMFAAVGPCCNGGYISYKKASLDNIVFPPGPGTPFIQSAADTRINNPSSTKQNLTAATDLVVFAGDDTSHYYLHNRIDLGTTTPDTTITGGPPEGSIVASPSVAFTYASTVPTSTFECALDGATYQSCPAGGASYGGLGTGPHSFAVRALHGGQTDATPAVRAFSVDLSIETTIDTGPVQGSVSPSPSAAFTYSSSQPASTFECATDAGAFVSCPAAGTSYPGLADGAHTFQVRAINGAVTDQTPATRTWTVDTTVPDTTIGSGPSGTATSTTASFSFTASEPSTFQCLLDQAPTGFSPCTSPVTYTGLTNSSHNFQVRSTDPAGNVDPTPADRTWTVNAVLFGDDFESANFSAWSSVTTSGDGTASVVAAIGRNASFGARLTGTINAQSAAYVTKTLTGPQDDLTVRGYLRMVTMGNDKVPMLTLLDASGNKVAQLQRLTSGRFALVIGSTTFNADAAGNLTLGGPYRYVSLHVVNGGAGTSLIELRVDGTSVFSTTTATVTANTTAVRLGNSDKKKAFAAEADEITISVGE